MRQLLVRWGLAPALSGALLLSAGCGSSSSTGDGGPLGGPVGDGGEQADGFVPIEGPVSVEAGADVTVTWPVNRASLAAMATPGARISWTQQSGPAPSTLRASGSLVVATALRIGEYRFRATADGGRGNTASDEVLVKVLPAQSPPQSPLDHASALPQPWFRDGHTLLPLTRWTGMHLLSFQKVMAERYGYALDLGDTSCGWEGDLALANGLIAQKIALKRSDPRRYPLSIQVHRPLVYPDRSCPGGYQDPTFKTKYPSAYLQNGQVSPEAPVAMWQELAQISEARLKKIVAKVATEVPVSPRVDVILNGGEYGVGVWTDDDAKWLGDAAVASSLAARFGLASAQAATDTQKFLYLSENKRRLEQVVTQAHVAANPGGMYVWYQTWSAGWRERWGGWWRYTHDYEVIRPLSTPTNLAYPSIYYRDFSSQVTGWTGDKDALSQLTNAAAWQLPAGAPLQYLSTCGGWPHSGSGFPADQLLASDASYMGYLKMAYAVGLVGATGGYFTNPGWGSEATGASATMPNWVRQLVTLGEVHALYSHVEALLRDGTLLPGPRKHKWSKGKPAYELDALVNGQADPLVRVVARRANAQARWLVALWAVDEIDRDVSVTVETLPAQTLRARAAGSVYVLTQESGGLRVELLDQEPMAPTDTLLPTDAW